MVVVGLFFLNGRFCFFFELVFVFFGCKEMFQSIDSLRRMFVVNRNMAFHDS